MSALQPAENSQRPIDFTSIERIAVFRALQLGDLLCVVPALRALRAAAPRARITLIGLPWAESFVARYSAYVDELMAFPGFPGLPEIEPQLSMIPAFMAQAQRRQFDLAIQLHGSGSLVNPLVAAMSARRSAGFCTPDDYCPDPELFIDWDDNEHEVLRYLRLMNHLGIPSQGETLAFPLMEKDYQSLSQSGAVLPASGSYVCVHPGARLKSRRWPPQRFARIADSLADQGLQVVLTGSQDERDIINEVKSVMRAPVLDMCGRTDLGALAVLVSRARMVLCNDTGISHIAAAVATPSVVVCSGGDHKRWAPLDRRRHRVLHADVACRPCAYVECPIGHPCADAVSAGMVLAEVLSLLDSTGKNSNSRAEMFSREQGASVTCPTQALETRSMTS